MATLRSIAQGLAQGVLVTALLSVTGCAAGLYPAPAACAATTSVYAPSGYAAYPGGYYANAYYANAYYAGYPAVIAPPVYPARPVVAVPRPVVIAGTAPTHRPPPMPRPDYRPGPGRRIHTFW